MKKLLLALLLMIAAVLVIALAYPIPDYYGNSTSGITPAPASSAPGYKTEQLQSGTTDLLKKK